MELKVFKDTIAASGGRWETRLELPVETEILIPDYLPAVFKIVKCLIEPVVLQNHLGAGRWQGEGYLRCTVYYQSDEAGTRLYRTEQKFSFERTVELPSGRYIEGPATLWGELEYCNCRAISEHRIDLRGAYALAVAAEQIDERELVTSLAECGIEQRTAKLAGELCVAAEEKTLSSETTIPLPGAGEAILDIGGSFSRESCTVQTGQVSCKGSLQVQVCFRPANEEELAVRQKDLPVQQTVELAGAAEGDTACIWGEILGCTLAAPEGGEQEPVLTVTWKLHVELWRAVEYMAVADAYSTQCETQVTRAEYRLLQRKAQLEAKVKVEIEDDMPDPDAQVKGCFVRIGAPVLAPVGEGEVQVTGKGVAHVLCADARGELTCYDKAFSWALPERWQGSGAEHCLHAAAVVVHVASGKNGPRLRVEAELSVNGLLLGVARAELASAVEAGEPLPPRGDGPALYLYYATQGERVFDIAKRYHARAKDLAAANQMEPGIAPQDLTTDAACLLVPAAL